MFIAGLAFNYAVKAQERAEEENVQEAINRFFNLPIFILLGLTIPWQQWGKGTSSTSPKGIHFHRQMFEWIPLPRLARWGRKRKPVKYWQR